MLTRCDPGFQLDGFDRETVSYRTIDQLGTAASHDDLTGEKMYLFFNKQFLNEKDVNVHETQVKDVISLLQNAVSYLEIEEKCRLISPTIMFENGSKYYGSIDQQNRMDGFGAWLDPQNHVIYSGDWKANTYEGTGWMLFWANDYNPDESWIYKGQFVNGYRQGSGQYGVLSHEVRQYDWYVGEWQKDKKHGTGVFYYDNCGFYFTGLWKDDEKNGKGEIWTTSDPFESFMEGVWKDDQINKITKLHPKFSQDAEMIRFFSKHILTDNINFETITDDSVITTQLNWAYAPVDDSGGDDGSSDEMSEMDQEEEDFSHETLYIIKTMASVDALEKFEKEVQRMKNKNVLPLNLPDGQKYYGESLDGRPNGIGVVIDADDRVVYGGEWKNGKEHGFGIKYYWDQYREENTIVYNGDWDQGKRKGKGGSGPMFDEGDLHWYEGAWDNDKKNGQGEFNFYGPYYYDGHWKDDKMDGEGALLQEDTLLEGIWESDVLQTITFLNDSVVDDANDSEFIFGFITQPNIDNKSYTTDQNIQKKIADIYTKHQIDHRHQFEVGSADADEGDHDVSMKDAPDTGSTMPKILGTWVDKQNNTKYTGWMLNGLPDGHGTYWKDDKIVLRGLFSEGKWVGSEYHFGYVWPVQ